ncbi:hypothetical protein [Niveibacterium terrae]|uniref:hypothetical protein n=1 Tax=Niveibacterium terrae TaxID=3373598 RepID=UPI003A8CC043
MDLDDLATAITQASGDPAVTRLSGLLVAWKNDAANVKELENTVERFIGNTWIESAAEHAIVYGLWSKFRDDAIHGIGGMTVNERLCCFSLFARWDGAKDDREREAIYAKLLATP